MLYQTCKNYRTYIFPFELLSSLSSYIILQFSALHIWSGQVAGERGQVEKIPGSGGDLTPRPRVKKPPDKGNQTPKDAGDCGALMEGEAGAQIHGRTCDG